MTMVSQDKTVIEIVVSSMRAVGHFPEIGAHAEGNEPGSVIPIRVDRRLPPGTLILVYADNTVTLTRG